MVVFCTLKTPSLFPEIMNVGPEVQVNVTKRQTIQDSSVVLRTLSTNVCVTQLNVVSL